MGKYKRIIFRNYMITIEELNNKFSNIKLLETDITNCSNNIKKAAKLAAFYFT